MKKITFFFFILMGCAQTGEINRQEKSVSAKSSPQVPGDTYFGLLLWRSMGVGIESRWFLF